MANYGSPPNAYSNPKNINLKKGVLRFGESKSANPFSGDATGWGLYVDSSNQLTFWNKTAVAVVGTGSTGSTPTWENMFSSDKTFTITPDTTFTIAGNRVSATDVVTFTNIGSATGDVIHITNSGTGSDIAGTSDTWSISKAGLITCVGITTTSDITSTGAAIDWDLKDNDSAALSIDTSGKTGLITIVTSTSAEGVTMSGTLGVTGKVTFDADSNTINSLSIQDDTVTTFGNGTTEDAGMVVFGSDTITTGDLLRLQLDESALAGGAFIKCVHTDGPTQVFAIKEGGEIEITGLAGFDMFTITSGDIVGSDTSITLTDADNAVTLSVTNDFATTASVIAFAGSGVFTGTTTASWMTITPSGLTSGTGVYAVGAGLVNGKLIHLTTDATMTTGSILYVQNTGASSACTSGTVATFDHTASGVAATVNKTGSVVSVTSSRTITTGGTTADDFDLLSVVKTTTRSAGTAATAGSVLYIGLVTTGTVTETSNGIELVMDAGGTGDGISLTHSATGAKALDVTGAATTADDVQINASGAHTNGLAALHVKTTGDLADGGANMILTLTGSSCDDNARVFEIAAAKDVVGMYCSTATVTQDAYYFATSGATATGKATMHIEATGTAAADASAVLRVTYGGTATAESRCIDVAADGLDVVGLYIDTENTVAAHSGSIVLYSNATGAQGPSIIGHLNSASPAADDQLFGLYVYGEETTSSDTMLFGQITIEAAAVTDGAVEGAIKMACVDGAAYRESFWLTDDTLALGDSAAFTIGSNGSQDLTISTAIDTAGINTLEPKIVMTDGADGDITVTAGGTSGEFVLASPLQVCSNIAVTADTGSSQGDGAQTKDLIEISVCANAGDAITLPGAEAGKIMYVINKGAQSADVFPASSDQINEGGANVQVAVAVNAGRIFLGIDGTHWESWLLARA